MLLKKRFNGQIINNTSRSTIQLKYNKNEKEKIKDKFDGDKKKILYTTKVW